MSNNSIFSLSNIDSPLGDWKKSRAQDGDTTGAHYYARSGEYLGYDSNTDDNDKAYTLDTKENISFQKERVTFAREFLQQTREGDFSWKYLLRNRVPLDLSHYRFRVAAGVLAAEESNETALLWMAHTIQNCVDRPDCKSGYNNAYSLLMSGYSSVKDKKNKVLSYSDNSLKANYARKAFISALTSQTDPTRGATLWDGVDYIAKGRYQPKFTQYRQHFIKETIFNTYKDNVWKRWKNTRIVNDQQQIKSGKYWYTFPSKTFDKKKNKDNWINYKSQIWGKTYGFFIENTSVDNKKMLTATGAQGASIFWHVGTIS